MRISDWSSDVCSSDLAIHTYGPARDFRAAGICVVAAAQHLRTAADLREAAGTADLAREGSVDAARGQPGCPQTDVSAAQTTVVEHADLDVESAQIERRTRIHGYRSGQAAECRSAEHTSELQSLMRTSY